MTPVDAALLSRWIERQDAEAFHQLTKNYAAMVYATCTRIAGNRAAAEDITQDCFARLATMRPAPKGHLGAWLHKVATNRALDYLKVSGVASNVNRDTSPSSPQPLNRCGMTSPSSSMRRSRNCPSISTRRSQTTSSKGTRTPKWQRCWALPARRRPIASGKALRRCAKCCVNKALCPGSGCAVRIARSQRGARGGAPRIVDRLAGQSRDGRHAPRCRCVGKCAGHRRGYFACAETPCCYGDHAALGWTRYLDVQQGIGHTANSLARTRRARRDSQTVEVPADSVVSAPAATDGDNENGASVAAVIADILTTAADEQESTGGTITGRIYDVKTGRGIAGASPIVRSSKGRDRYAEYIKSDTDGNYRVEGLAPSSYEICVSKLPGYSRITPWNALSVTVDEGQILKDIDLSLDHGYRVSGKVVFADGSPASDVRIGAMLPDMDGAEMGKSTDDGSFDLRLVKLGDDLMIQAKMDEYESKSIGPYRLKSAGLDGLLLELTEPRTSSISGIVAAPGGRRIADVSIHLNRGRTAYLIGLNRAKSNEEGTFTIDALSPGEYEIFLSSPGVSSWNPSLPPNATANLSAGQVLTGLRVIFVEEKGGYSIAGIALDTSEKPIAGAEISASGPVSERVRSGSDGRFLITGLTEGMYFLNADHRDASTKTNRYNSERDIRVAAGATDVVWCWESKAPSKDGSCGLTPARSYQNLRCLRHRHRRVDFMNPYSSMEEMSVTRKVVSAESSALER